jgi:hypothetical protein
LAVSDIGTPKIGNAPWGPNSNEKRERRNEDEGEDEISKNGPHDPGLLDVQRNRNFAPPATID